MAAEVGIDVGIRRRLPPWMQGVAVADQGRKSRNEDEENVSSKLANSSIAPQPKRKSRAKRLEKETQLSDKELADVDSSLLVKCAKKSRKTNIYRRDVGSDSLTHSEDEVPKKRIKRTCGTQREVQETTPQKKRRGKNYKVESSDDIQALSPMEEDEELTMEDLIRIAEEYVKADNEINNQPSEREEAASVTQPLAANFSSIESGGSLKNTQSSRESSTHPTETSTSNLIKAGFKDQDDSISKIIMTDLSRTGDPTQDMLDLFLGPLLKKPQKEERKTEITTEEILAYEFRKQSQSQSVKTEVVPLVKKKKSSLKDKISMFLD